MTTSKEFLEHFGTRGMRWGVRNKSSSSSKSSSKTQYSKAPKRLSEAQLSSRIKRMDLEKRYSELKTPTKSTGKKYVHDLLQNSGKTVTATVVSSVTAFMIGRALRKKFGG